MLLGIFTSTAHAAGEGNAAITPEQVIGRLNQTLAWYREARVATHSLGELFAREDQQTALALLRRAFETARAQAAAVAGDSNSAGDVQRAQAGPKSGKRAELNAAIQADVERLEQLRQQLQTARGARRTAIQADLAAASNKLEFDRVRLDFLTKLDESNLASSDTEVDLTHQIQALQESVPELSATNALPSAAPTAPAASVTSGQIHRLIDIRHAADSLDHLTASTKALEQGIGDDLRATQASVRPIMSQLRGLTTDPSPGGSLADGQRQFRALLDRSKQLGAVVLSLRDEAALAHRFAADLESWRGELDRDRWQVLQSLGFGLIGVVLAVAAILVGGVLWRVAAGRYVHDAYRRRLLIVARNVVVMTAIALVLVFHFASELTVLVTGLGFAAAGIAFALQNVILALVGYFSMVAPNGIRVGDRVSLQGPFGYVQGEVLDIGLVRIRLRELDSELQPTGRIVVFPNSVVFTGSFFKLPPPGDRGERPRSVGPSAAA
jgi:hypothetical protein